METPKIQRKITFRSFQVSNCSFQAGETASKDGMNDLQIKIRYWNEFPNDDHAFYVVFELETTSKSVSVSITSKTLFSTDAPVDSAFRESPFVRINAPAIAFPFLRSFLQTLCINAGIPPIVLPAYNFSKFPQSGSSERNNAQA